MFYLRTHLLSQTSCKLLSNVRTWKQKKFIGRLSLAALVMTAAASCDENSWNNHLDGFEEVRRPTHHTGRNRRLHPSEASTAQWQASPPTRTSPAREGAAALEAVGKLKRFQRRRARIEIPPRIPQHQHVPLLHPQRRLGCESYLQRGHGRARGICRGIAPADLLHQLRAV